MNHEILLGLTTTSNSEWRKKIEETIEFDIQKLALFLTGLDQIGRKEAYRLLDKSPVTSIPHVHIRNDCELWELDMLAEKYGTVAFNMHTASHYPWINDYSKYRSQIYLENAGMPTDEDMQAYPGLCLDFSHWENRAIRFRGQEDERTAKLLEYIERYPVGCCHVSAIKPHPVHVPSDENEGMMYDDHRFESLSELAYLKKYQQYLPYYISLELVNPFAEQLKAKAYLENLLFGQ